MPNEDSRSNAAEQRLRQDIDSGRTGDKVDALDPAVVPLGTDAEAGGTSTDPVAASRAREDALKGPETPRPSSPQIPFMRIGFALFVAAVLALLLIR